MKKLKKIWKERRLILQGAQRYLFKTKFVEKVSAYRMEICNECDELDTKGNNCVLKGSQPCCSNCGCSLAFKTRSLSSECPLGKWGALENDDDE
jgi:formylmethanofuran dehydrogenase subunit E